MGGVGPTFFFGGYTIDIALLATVYTMGGT